MLTFAEQQVATYLARCPVWHGRVGRWSHGRMLIVLAYRLFDGR